MQISATRHSLGVSSGRTASFGYSFSGSDVNRDASCPDARGGCVGRESGTGASTTGSRIHCFRLRGPKDLMARFICRHVQEQAFGGFDRDTAKLLDGLGRGKPAADRSRRLKPGIVLVREYAGERHSVTVVPGGYVWRESTYPSLSTIARAITGTTWNGPRFFGLRVPANGS